MLPTSFASLPWLAVYILIGGVSLWGLARRLTQDRLLGRVLLWSYGVRVVLALVLFAASLWHWPLLTSLQTSYGFWTFGGDGQGYHYIGTLIADALAQGVELPRLETAIDFYAVVAAVYRLGDRLWGAHPLYPILINCWLAAATGLLAYLIARRLTNHHVARVSAALVSFWPSSFLWSAQLLKDALCWFLLFLVLWLIIRLMPSGERASWRSWVQGTSRWLGLVLAVIGLTKLRGYMGLALALAVLAILGPSGMAACVRRQASRGLRSLGLAVVVCLAMLFARTLNLTKLLSPAHPEVGHFRLAVSSLRLGDFGEAEDEFSRAIGLKPDYREAYLGLAAAAVQETRWEQAIWAYTRGLPHATAPQQAAIKPIVAALYVELGNQELMNGKADAAIPRYTEALVYDPSMFEAKTNLGLALAHAGDFDQAFLVFTQALQEAASKPQQRAAEQGLAQAYLALAWHNARLNRWQEAVTAAVTSLHLDAMPRAFAECGLMMAEAQLIDEALTMTTRALERSASGDADAVTVRWLVAKIYRAKGDHEVHLNRGESAAQFYAESLRLDADPDTARRLQLLLEALHIAPQGVESWATSVSLTPQAVSPQGQPLQVVRPGEPAPPVVVSLSQADPRILNQAVTLFSSHAGEWSERAVESRRQRDALAQLNARALQMKDQAVFSAYETTPAALADRREGFVSTGGHSLMDAWAKISTPRKLLTYLPRAMAIGVLAPFPSQWFDVRGSTGVMRAFAGLEMLMIYLLLPGIGVGIWRTVTARRAEGWFLLACVFATAIPISLVVANLGTLFRLRLMFLLPLLIVAAGGGPLAVYQAGLMRIRALLTKRPQVPEAAVNPPAASRGEPSANAGVRRGIEELV